MLVDTTARFCVHDRRFRFVGYGVEMTAIQVEEWHYVPYDESYAMWYHRYGWGEE